MTSVSSYFIPVFKEDQEEMILAYDGIYYPESELIKGVWSYYPKKEVELMSLCERIEKIGK